MARSVSLVALVLGVALSPASARADVVLSGVMGGAHDYSIRLPDGWTAIPEETFARMANASDDVRIRFDHGFYEPFDGDGGEASLPFVFIGAADIGRTHGLRLQGIPRAPSGWTPTSIAPSGRLYDPALYTVWDRADRDDVVSLTVQRLNQVGNVSVVFLLHVDDLEAYGPLFQEVVESIQVSPAIAYQPDTDLAAEAVGMGRPMGIAAGLLFALLWGLARGVSGRAARITARTVAGLGCWVALVVLAEPLGLNTGSHAGAAFLWTSFIAIGLGRFLFRKKPALPTAPALGSVES